MCGFEDGEGGQHAGTWQVVNNNKARIQHVCEHGHFRAGGGQMDGKIMGGREAGGI